MSNNPDENQAYSQNQGRLKLDAYSGLAYYAGSGYVPMPMSEEQYQRLMYVYNAGAEISTAGYYDYALNPNQDDLNLALNGAINNPVYVREIIDGTVFYHTDINDLPAKQVYVIPVTQAAELDYPRAKDYVPPPLGTADPPGKPDAGWFVLHIHDALALGLENLPKRLAPIIGNQIRTIDPGPAAHQVAPIKTVEQAIEEGLDPPTEFFGQEVQPGDLFIDTQLVRDRRLSQGAIKLVPAESGLAYQVGIRTIAQAEQEGYVIDDEWEGENIVPADQFIEITLPLPPEIPPPIPGPPGPPGLPGKDGEDGKDGLDGLPGLPGAPGADGKDGKDGADGKDGTNGIDGQDGLQGVSGPVGPAGPVGPVGPGGPVGPVGPVGPGGQDGGAGPAGPAGPVGPAGPAGPGGPVGPVGPVGPGGTPTPPDNDPWDNSGPGIYDACLPTPILIYENKPGFLAGAGWFGQQLEENHRDLRGAINTFLAQMNPDYRARNLISLTLIFSGWGEVDYSIAGVAGLVLYTPPSLTLPMNGFPQEIQPLPGVEFAGFNLTVPPVGAIAAAHGNIWYRDRVTVGADNNPIGCSEIQLDYSFMTWLGIPDQGAEHEPDNAVRMWLACFKYASADGQTDLPITQDFHQSAQPWEYGAVSNQDGWDGEGYPNTVYFDQRVYMGLFYFPGDGDIFNRLHIFVTASFRGISGQMEVTLFDATTGQNVTTWHIDQDGAGKIASGYCSNHFIVNCSHQYRIQMIAQVGPGGWWEPHFVSVSMDDIVYPPPPPPMGGAPVDFDDSYPDKQGWDGGEWVDH